jgi:dTDP-4-amino-4,6-dideoxygalactose transaminase
MDVPFYRHDLTASYASEIEKVLSSPFLTSGPVGRQVEEHLRKFFDIPHALLVNSWTNGAVATLLALDVGPGDEVIVPAQTFVATSNVVELVGARPVFVDVDPRTLLIDLEAAHAAITSATKAIIPVHLYGQMCDIAALRSLLGARDIAIVEDSAHCFEGSIHGIRPGRLSDAAIFSFYATKNVTCGEGGAIVTHRQDLHDKLVQTRVHGMSAAAMDRFSGKNYRHWDVARLGTKANLPDLLAALLPRQIERVAANLDLRERVAERYERALRDTPIRHPQAVEGVVNARHLFPIYLPPALREEALARFGRAGIGVTINYPAIPGLTYYARKYNFKPNAFPVSDDWGKGTLSLPFFAGLTEVEQDYVIEVLKREIVPMFERHTGAGVQQS